MTSQDVDEPILPHKRKQTCRYEKGNDEYDPSPTYTYRRIYYEAVDLLIQAINSRSDQPGIKMYCCLLSLVAKLINKQVNLTRSLKFMAMI